MGFMGIVTNRYVLLVAGLLAWTMAVHKFAYDAGYDEANAECQSVLLDEREAVISSAKAKLHAQAILYENDIQEAQAEAYRERKRRQGVERAMETVRSVAAPDCSRIPDEWVREVGEAWRGGGD